MNFLLRKISFVTLLFSAILLFDSCGGEKLCAGLNNGTGSANTSKGARKKNRGGYKSQQELSARDRQKKRIKKSKRKKGRGTMGGSKKGFSASFSLRGKNGRVSGSAQGQVKH